MTAAGFLFKLMWMTRVLIVDDQPIFRRQLSELLRRAGLEDICQAGDIRTAEAMARREQPDLALVDVMLPGVSGIAGVPLLKKAAPKMRIVLVSAYHDQYELFQASALSAGAEAFISKDELDLEMIEKLKISSGE